MKWILPSLMKEYMSARSACKTIKKALYEKRYEDALLWICSRKIGSLSHIRGTCLIWYAICCSAPIDILDALLRNGCDVNEPNKISASCNSGASPLHAAVIVKSHRVKYTRWLVDNNARVNSRTAHGETPLHFVCALPKPDCAEIVGILLSNGAQPSVISKVCFKTCFFRMCID
jgi:hypothetical protein